MIGALKVIGGDYKYMTVCRGWTGGVSHLACNQGVFKSVKMKKKDITSCHLISESNKASILGKVGWGAVGAAALGPLGLLAGVLGGGNSKEIVVALEFHDGTRALVTGPKADMEALLKFAY